MNTHEVLVKARNLIADEVNWCGTGWVGPRGQPCVLHAIAKASGMWTHDPATLPGYSVLREMLPSKGSVGAFNDTHTHAEVLALCDKAIAATAPEPDTSFLTEVQEPVAA